MNALQVLPLMRRMGRRVRQQDLGIPSEHVDPLKRMLAIGVLVYMKLPLPDCMTDDGLETSHVQKWSVSASLGKRNKRKVGLTSLPYSLTRCHGCCVSKAHVHSCYCTYLDLPLAQTFQVQHKPHSSTKLSNCRIRSSFHTSLIHRLRARTVSLTDPVIH